MNEIRDFKKMKRAVLVLKKVLHVAAWILIVIVASMGIGEAVVLMLSDKYFILTDFYNGQMTFAVERWFDFELIGEMGNSISLKPVVLLVLPAITLASLFYLINIKQIQNILKSIVEDRPFDEQNARSLFIMSINFFVASIAFQVAGNLVAAKVISLVNINLGNIRLLPDFSMVLTGLLLMILSGVFKYGHYLQEEYNETV